MDAYETIKQVLKEEIFGNNVKFNTTYKDDVLTIFVPLTKESESNFDLQDVLEILKEEADSYEEVSNGISFEILDIDMFLESLTEEVDEDEDEEYEEDYDDEEEEDVEDLSDKKRKLKKKSCSDSISLNDAKGKRSKFTERSAGRPGDVITLTMPGDDREQELAKAAEKIMNLIRKEPSCAPFKDVKMMISINMF